MSSARKENESGCSPILLSGMGFAVLAGLPPVYGLYASFWCVLLYFVFGQSPHMSFGTMAIISIMLSEATNEAADELTDRTIHTENQSHLRIVVPPELASMARALQNKTGLGGGMEDESSVIARTMLVTMLAGMILVVMSLFKLDRAVAFLPTSCISGFTTAAAFHIVTSQFKFLLGIHFTAYRGNFKLAKTWREIALQVSETNTCDLVISISCLVVLFVIKEILNPRYRHKLLVPIPAEILVVTVLTLVSHYAALNEKYEIQVLNDTPAGFTTPVMPDFHNAENYVVDAFLIAIISFVISYSMVSMFARKHRYEIDTSQEMMAYGMCCLIGSLFGTFAGAAAPPRCTVLDTTGAKTQVVHVYSGLVLLLTILFLGPLFKPLPSSCLAAIIVCALIPLFKQFQNLAQYWKINKYDFFIWLITWAAVLILDIDTGLAVGVGFSLATVVIQAWLSNGTTLEALTTADLLAPKGKYEHSQEIPGIKIFRFESSLHFASQSRFRESLFTSTKDPLKAGSKETSPKHQDQSNVLRTVLHAVRKKHTSKVYTISRDTDTTQSHLKSNTSNTEIHTIIIDCSCISYIDMMGLNLLKHLKADYGLIDVNIVLANCTGAILPKLKAAGITHDEGAKHASGTDPEKIEVFPTVQDAVAKACQNRRQQRENLKVKHNGSLHHEGEKF